MRWMKRTGYYLRLIRGYMRRGFLRMVQYPADTFIMLFSMLAREAMGLIGIMAVANVMGGLGDWAIYEILLIFSMCAMTESVSQAFLDNVWGLDHDIRKGQLDVYYVRPAPIFLQLLGQIQHYQAIISFTVYTALMIFSVWKLEVSITPAMLLFFLEFFVCATAINTGIYTIFNSLNFWIIQGEDIAGLVQTCREFAKYPLNVFPKVIQIFFTAVIPFGFVGYYPAAFISGKGGGRIALFLFLAAAGVAAFAAVVWRKGVRSYESTGN